jgi:hypothetical protein
VFSSFEISLCHCCIAQLKTAHSCYKEAPSAAKEVSFESEKKKMAPKRDMVSGPILPIGAVAPKRDMVGGPILPIGAIKNGKWLSSEQAIWMIEMRPVEIFIKNTMDHDQSITVAIDNTTTTNSIKEVIAGEFGIPPDRQVLKQVMKDGILMKSEIEDGDTLWVEDKYDTLTCEPADAEPKSSNSNTSANDNNNKGYKGNNGVIGRGNKEHQGLKRMRSSRF